MNVNEVYQLMEDILSKNVQQGYLSPANFQNWINQAQRSYTDELLGEFQKYKDAHPIAPIQFGANERVRNSIAPLIYGTILNIYPYGLANYPSDYEYVDAMWGVYGHYNIRFAQQNQLDSFLHSEIDPIEENPVYLLEWRGIQFYPEDLGMARMSYVRTPPSIVWGYVEDSNGIPAWNPATSQNPVWGDTDMLNIIVRALAMAGVSMDFKTVLGYSQNIKQGGQ